MRPRPLIGSALGAAGFAAVLVLAVTWARLDRWLEDTAPLAEWFVALGTGALALATYALARRAKQQIDAATRPLVYPLVSYEWAQGTAGSRYDGRSSEVLPLKNGGHGVAMNVHGACYLPNPPPGSPRRSLEVQGGTIAAGDLLDARLEETLAQGWREGIDGFVVYEDTAGDEWVTHFRFGRGRTGQLVCFHEPPGRVADLGDPRLRYKSDLGGG